MIRRRQLYLLAALLWPLTLAAEHAHPLDRLLRQVQQSGQQEAQVRQQREQQFLAAQAEQKTLLDELKARLAAERARGEGLRESFDANEKALAELETELKHRTGDLGEVFGTVRQAAKDISALLRDSLVSGQLGGRADWLQQLGESKKLPAGAELERLWRLIQQEMLESGRVVRFPATVIDTDGRAAEVEVVRVGLFSALAQGRYLSYQAETGRFVVLPRQPAVERHLGAQGGGLALDPTRGVLLGMLVETPDLAERLHQGGLVGYVIMALGALGLVIVAVRLAYLGVVGRRMHHQLQDLATPDKRNPLGRILAVAASSPDLDTSHLELQIDEVILRELPRLTRGEGLVKLLTGVAPLLGLLGTVVGMIKVFAAITAFGVGDPTVLSEGISNALITTAAGLSIGIPALMFHRYFRGRVNELTVSMEQTALHLVEYIHGDSGLVTKGTAGRP